nr:IS4 family transposase [Parabacteroides sp. AD58]
MGKTKYETDLGNKTVPELIKTLQKSRNVKYSRSIGYYTATVSAKISGIKVSLFFYRRGKKGNWNALLTSDLKLDAKEAFRLYSRRWVIEVAHKEM